MAGDIAHAAFVREEGVNVLLSIWRLLKTPHIFVASYELRAAKTMNHAVVAVLPAASGRDMERRGTAFLVGTYCSSPSRLPSGLWQLPAAKG